MPGTHLYAAREVVRGALQGARAEAVTYPFPACTTVLLYTDGLVEERRVSIDVGLERLRAAAAGAPDVEAICRAVERDVVPARQTDDIAFVAARVPALRDMPGPKPNSNSGYLGIFLEANDGAPKIERVEPNSAAATAASSAIFAARSISPTIWTVIAGPSGYTYAGTSVTCNTVTREPSFSARFVAKARACSAVSLKSG